MGCLLAVILGVPGFFFQFLFFEGFIFVKLFGVRTKFDLVFLNLFFHHRTLCRKRGSVTGVVSLRRLGARNKFVFCIATFAGSGAFNCSTSEHGGNIHFMQTFLFAVPVGGSDLSIRGRAFCPVVGSRLRFRHRLLIRLRRSEKRFIFREGRRNRGWGV